jgi:hypothetical protein
VARNMNNYIFKQETGNKNNSLSSYFTILGEEDFMDANQLPRCKHLTDKVYAKEIINELGIKKYHIRLSLSNKLYDPTSIYGLDKTKSFLDSTVRDPNRFKTVNFKTFSLYLSFLKTKNRSYLFNAEREAE